MYPVTNTYSLAADLLSKDRCYKLISLNERELMINTALEIGLKRAKEMAFKYPGLGPLALADVLGIGVNITDMNNTLANLLIRGRYTPEPPQIIIYQKSLQALNKIVIRSGLSKLISETDLLSVHVAHEIFHHIEVKRKDFVSDHFRVTTFSLGPFRVMSGISALSEIAAHSFAQRFTGIIWYPYLLDLLEVVSIRYNGTNNIKREGIRPP